MLTEKPFIIVSMILAKLRVEFGAEDINSCSPVFLMGKSDLRCMVEGSSFMRSDSCRLKGDVFWLSAGKPLKEPCLARASAGACLRGIT